MVSKPLFFLPGSISGFFSTWRKWACFSSEHGVSLMMYNVYRCRLQTVSVVLPPSSAIASEIRGENCARSFINCSTRATRSNSRSLQRASEMYLYRVALTAAFSLAKLAMSALRQLATRVQASLNCSIGPANRILRPESKRIPKVYAIRRERDTVTPQLRAMLRTARRLHRSR